MAQVTLREYLQEIEDTLSAGNIDDATNKCQHVLARFPEALEVQRLLGEVYLAQGQMEDAQQALDWILTNDPENVIAYCDRALISERLSDFDTALDCYQQAYELSRGNRDIRQQFNVLSAKVGQQGFMFSRAGLARLYMRGGLLPQAIQEWDAVLSVSPDRLDARTGLLEAYWREGLHDEAEQLALHTLQDVPGCAKALLILAHITAPKNMQQAREYVQRAELLDPDLLMAQELFEDMIMSQPGHPFLKLLKKAPTVIDTKQVSTEPTSTQIAAEPIFAHSLASQEASPVSDVPVYELPTSANFFEWNNLNSWNGAVETPVRAEAQEQPGSDVTALPTWSHDTFSDAWTPPVQPPQAQEPQKQAVPTLSEHTADVLEAPWMPGLQDETVATPPTWLNMLTQDELRGQRQPEDAIPSMREEHEQPQPSIAMPILPASQSHMETISAEASADTSSDTSWRDALQASLNTTADEEPFSFGPEWLKSLGATELGADAQQHPVSAPSASQAQPETALQPAELTQPLSAEPEPSHDTYEWSEPFNPSLQEPAPGAHAWLDALSVEPEHTQHPEQTVVNTLEGLEHSLLSEGFVPLEPNSLSAIAQSHESSVDTSAAPSPYSSREEMHKEEPYHASTLSSALEQLGNLATPHTAYHTSEPILPTAQHLSAQSSEEPLWAPGFYSVPAPLQEEAHAIWQDTPNTASLPIEAAMVNLAPPVSDIVPQEQQSTVPDRIEAFPGPIFEPTQEPQRAEVSNIPVARADAYFESELETTMRRPAIRLQALKPSQASVPATPNQRTSKGRGNEFTSLPASNGGRDGAQYSQERLVKGYQHQLVGDYDEAMQEYRIIIKSAPELLDEVVSNVRALLKLAPKYSAGYRVLGDAYMRQGEYLQAMEAYNKALTMAKKAKV
ncbi:MAG: hypothetical protein NVSMB54_17380 [Ktedonobacteraceae bacterium]